MKRSTRNTVAGLIVLAASTLALADGGRREHRPMFAETKTLAEIESAFARIRQDYATIMDEAAAARGLSCHLEYDFNKHVFYEIATAQTASTVAPVRS